MLLQRFVFNVTSVTRSKKNKTKQKQQKTRSIHTPYKQQHTRRELTAPQSPAARWILYADGYEPSTVLNNSRLSEDFSGVSSSLGETTARDQSGMSATASSPPSSRSSLKRHHGRRRRHRDDSAGGGANASALLCPSLIHEA